MDKSSNGRSWIVDEYIFLFRRDVFQRGYDDARRNREPLIFKMQTFLEERHYGKEDSQRVLTYLESAALGIFDKIPFSYTWIIEAVRELEVDLNTFHPKV